MPSDGRRRRKCCGSTPFVLVLLLAVSSGCTLDTTAMGVECVDLTPFTGCFARTPEAPSLDDPEMYIHIIQAGACDLSGYGWGLLVPYTFTSERVIGVRVSLDARGGGDEAYTEHYRMSVEPTSDAGGILLTVRDYRSGSSGDWQSWPEPYDRPFYLTRTACLEETGD